jgi:hypothetical protein
VSELEPASFDVERFEVGADARLEVHGRWSGVRGRRFMRPALTAVAGGREYRLLAVLDHKPWVAEEGEPWLAVFPWSTDPAGLDEAELTVAPDVTVPLPPPSSVSDGARRRSSRPARTRQRNPGDANARNGRSKSGDRGRHERRPSEERAVASRSNDDLLLELDAVKRDGDRLRVELREALAAREAAIAERHDVIESEVRLRIADLQAETERERAAAGQAAQFASERDGARTERAEALGERDEALAEEAMRRWEATAALGTRRTQQRDAAASERNRAARERHAALEDRDRLAGERDAMREELEQARQKIAGLAEQAATQLNLEEHAALTDETPTAGSHETVATRSASEERHGSAPRSSPTPTARPAAPRPRRPPAPAPTRPHHTGLRGTKPRPSPQAPTTTDAAEMWRARILAVAALLVALVVFLVILIAK